MSLPAEPSTGIAPPPSLLDSSVRKAADWRHAWQRRRRFRDRALDGLRTRGTRYLCFVTLTCPSFQSELEVSDHLHALSRLLREEFGSFEYCGRAETQGIVNVHLLAYFGRFCPVARLSILAERAGFGKIVDIRRADANAIRYASKSIDGYISKRPGQAKAMISRGWLPKRSTMERVADDLGKAVVSLNPSRRAPRR